MITTIEPFKEETKKLEVNNNNENEFVYNNN